MSFPGINFTNGIASFVLNYSAECQTLMLEWAKKGDLKNVVYSKKNRVQQDIQIDVFSILQFYEKHADIGGNCFEQLRCRVKNGCFLHYFILRSTKKHSAGAD